MPRSKSREDRRVHPQRAARLGHQAGRGTGPGRREAGRPATAAGQRAVLDPPPRRRQDQGPVRRRAMFDAIAAVIDAKAKPLTGDDDRSGGERQAEALADVCGYVLDHAPSSTVPRLRRTPPARERAGPAGGPGEPGPGRGPRLRRPALARVDADAVLRRGGGADRDERPVNPWSRPGDTHHSRRAAPSGSRPGCGCAHPDATGRRRGASATTSCRGSAAARQTVESGHVVPGPPPADPLHGMDLPYRDGLPEFIPPDWI